MKTETFLPIFPGFYGSIFESDDDDALDCIKEDNPGMEIDWDDIEWDYDEYQQEMSIKCCEAIEGLLEGELGLKIKIKYEKLVSPREYNFKNDTINVNMTFTKATYKRVRILLMENKEALEEYLTENFKSRSGFMSFYDHDLPTFYNEYLHPDDEKFDKMFTYALEFLLREVAEINSRWLYDCIIDHPTLNGELKLMTMDGLPTEIIVVLAEQFAKEHGDFGYSKIIVDECRVYAEATNISLGEALKDKYPNVVIKEMFGSEYQQIPITEYKEIMKLVKTDPEDATELLLLNK
jgi:hypothetical protein